MTSFDTYIFLIDSYLFLPVFIISDLLLYYITILIAFASIFYKSNLFMTCCHLVNHCSYVSMFLNEFKK